MDDLLLNVTSAIGGGGRDNNNIDNSLTRNSSGHHVRRKSHHRRKSSGNALFDGLNSEIEGYNHKRYVDPIQLSKTSPASSTGGTVVGDGVRNRVVVGGIKGGDVSMNTLTQQQQQSQSHQPQSQQPQSPGSGGGDDSSNSNNHPSRGLLCIDTLLDATEQDAEELSEDRIGFRLLQDRLRNQDCVTNNMLKLNLYHIVRETKTEMIQLKEKTVRERLRQARKHRKTASMPESIVSTNTMTTITSPNSVMMGTGGNSSDVLPRVFDDGLVFDSPDTDSTRTTATSSTKSSAHKKPPLPHPLLRTPVL